MTLIYKILYRLHLVYCFFFRPKVYGAYCIISFNNKILLIKNSYKSYWTIPCGMVDKNESTLTAAIRETREEVGIKLDESTVSFVRYILSEDEYKKDHIYLYKASLLDMPIVQLDNKEVVDYQWVELTDLQNLSIFPPIKPFLFLDH